MSVKNPCGICNKQVRKNHRAIHCDICDKWIHIKCNYLDKLTLEKVHNESIPWYCLNCNKTFLPFSNITDFDLHNTMSGKILSFDKNYSLNHNSHLEKLFSNFLVQGCTKLILNCIAYIGVAAARMVPHLDQSKGVTPIQLMNV